MFSELEQAEKTSYNKGIKKPSKVVKNILFFLLVAFLVSVLGSVIATKASGKTPNVFGYYIFMVQTSSMDPTLPPGTMIVSKKPSDPSALAAGTIVTFKTSEGQRVTHRIMEVKKVNNSIVYITKGDNPINSPDKDPLDPEQIEAVYLFKLPSFKG